MASTASDLRRSCATVRLPAGAAIKVVQEEFGHAPISTTMDRYAHVLPSSRQGLDWPCYGQV